MAENLIYTTISPNKIKLKPGANTTQFEVDVRNDSDNYASFQLTIEADYDKGKQQQNWYRISPEIATFNPPGDQTKFQVELIDSPVPGFVGLMQLRVSVSSVELPDKDTLLLPVEIEQGTVKLPLELTLPVNQFQKSPGSIMDIPVIVRNLGQIPTNARLTFVGIDPEWIIDGCDRNFKLEGGQDKTLNFTCELPNKLETIAKVYSFKIEAEHSQGPSSQIEGQIEVLTMGYLDFGCQPKELSIPSRFSFAFWRNDPVTYILRAENASNMPQELVIDITKQGKEDDGGIFEVVEIETKEDDENIKGIIDNIVLEPKEIEPIALRAYAKRPFVGRTKKLIREVNAVWSGSDRIDTRNENQTIILNIKPIFATSFLVQSGIFILLLLYFFIFLNPSSHRHDNAVNSIEFNGVADNMISSSNDQTIIRWNTDGFAINPTPPKLGVIDQIGKAVRVARYKPVDNNVIAAGLENGEIQLWDLLSSGKKPLASFNQKEADDRVFDLTFSTDSRYLLSGHGSGNVLLWDITRELRGISNPNKTPVASNKFNFSINSMKLIGNEQNSLGVVGRYNQFMIWNNFVNNSNIRSVNYGIEGSQDNYIESLDVAPLKPYLAATGDNQGNITIWDLTDCTTLAQGDCGKMIDRWDDGHQKKAVRSVALSANGCYLATGGDDGTTRLWYLTDQGNKAVVSQQGEIIQRSKKDKKIITVDIITGENLIEVASGGEDYEVRYTEKERNYNLGCDNLP